MAIDTSVRYSGVRCGAWMGAPVYEVGQRLWGKALTGRDSVPKMKVHEYRIT